MSGNHKLSKIYNDPVNPKLCKEINEKLRSFFSIIQIKSKVDYREKYKINQEFFLLDNARITRKANLLKISAQHLNLLNNFFVEMEIASN